MAKSKFKKEVKQDETKDNIPIIPDEVKADAFIPQTEMEIIEDETVTVIGLAEAEGLQKSGWRLISVTPTSKGKEYKFKKGK